MARATDTPKGAGIGRDNAPPMAESFREEIMDVFLMSRLSNRERLLRVAKRHPFAIALLGLGLGWLLVEKRRAKVLTELGLSGRGLVHEAYRKDMGRTWYPPDPAAELPEAETAALRRGGFEAKPLGPREPGARAQTEAEYAALLESSLTAQEAARRLAMDPGRVLQLLADRQLYGLQLEGEWRIPEFQLDGTRLVPGLEEVLPALPEELHPLGIYRWFVTPNPDLAPEGAERELSPREWLLTGHDSRAVAELAADLDLL